MVVLGLFEPQHRCLKQRTVHDCFVDLVGAKVTCSNSAFDVMVHPLGSAKATRTAFSAKEEKN